MTAGPRASGPSATLLITCPDRPGIVAAVSGYLAGLGANILDSQQHSVPDEDAFFMRIKFEVPGGREALAPLAGGFALLAERFAMTHRFADDATPKRMAILVSRYDHCLYDLLLRQRSGELPVEVPVIISNHPDLAPVAAYFQVPYVHLPITPETKGEQEAAVRAELGRHQVDFVVMARYMQVLTGEFLAHYPHRVINIHHSFLPAFAGGRPYHQAHERGVKVIGATSHYATVDLDEGPIIEQDVTRVDHRHTVDDLVRKGRDLEKVVLARAVAAHAQDRVLVTGRRTVVFA